MRPEELGVGECPDDESLAAMVERRLAETELARLERHVATCRTCLDVVAAALSPMASSERLGMAEPTVPERAAWGAEGPARWGRWAIAASLVLVGGGMLLGLMTGAFGSRAVPRLAQLGARALGVPFQAAAVGVRMGGDPGSLVLSLREVAIGPAGAAWVKADEIALTIALTAPLSGSPMIGGIRVTRPDVDLIAYHPAAVAGSQAARAQAMAVLSMERVDVLDGRALLPGPLGEALVITGLTGGTSRDADGLQLVFEGRAAGGTVDLSGRIGPDAYDLALTIGGRNLDAAALPLLGDRVRGRMDLRLDVHAHGDRLEAEGRLALHDGSLLGRGPAALLALGSNVRETLAAFDPALAATDLAFDEARAAFAWRRGTWRLPRVFVRRRGIVAGGRARIDSRGEVSGQGTVRLPAELVTVVQPHEPIFGRFRDPNGVVTLPFHVTGEWAKPAIALGSR